MPKRTRVGGTFGLYVSILSILNWPHFKGAGVVAMLASARQLFGLVRFQEKVDNLGLVIVVVAMQYENIHNRLFLFPFYINEQINTRQLNTKATYIKESIKNSLCV